MTLTNRSASLLCSAENSFSVLLIPKVINSYYSSKRQDLNLEHSFPHLVPSKLIHLKKL